jgi:uncharacterized protein
MAAPITHFEIGGRDVARARKFYSELLGWEFQEIMGVAMVVPSGKGIGGHLNALGHEPANYVTIYAQVDNIEAYLDRATRLGGRTIVPKTEVPQNGWFAWFADPDGNVIGLWQCMPQK